MYSGLICLHSGLKTEIESDDDDLHNIWLRRHSIYRVSRVKLENCKLLFQTENMDRFLIKWCFYDRKGGEFYMVPQKFRKKYLQALKIFVKSKTYISTHQYIKLKENSNFNMGNVALTEIFSARRYFFLNFCGTI